MVGLDVGSRQAQKDGHEHGVSHVLVALLDAVLSIVKDRILVIEVSKIGLVLLLHVREHVFLVLAGDVLQPLEAGQGVLVVVDGLGVVLLPVVPVTLLFKLILSEEPLIDLHLSQLSNVLITDVQRMLQIDRVLIKLLPVLTRIVYDHLPCLKVQKVAPLGDVRQLIRWLDVLHPRILLLGYSKIKRV